MFSENVHFTTNLNNFIYDSTKERESSKLTLLTKLNYWIKYQK